jgi:hypothetical protein
VDRLALSAIFVLGLSVSCFIAVCVFRFELVFHLE